MNYIRLLGIFSCLCLWHFGNAAPYISVQSNSRSSVQEMVNGKMRTVYDVNSQHSANDLSGKMVHHATHDFNSDFNDPVHIRDDWR